MFEGYVFIHCLVRDFLIAFQILTISFLVFQHMYNTRILHLQPVQFSDQCKQCETKHQLTFRHHTSNHQN